MAIDWGRMAKGVATGYLGAKIANTEANDALQADILKQQVYSTMRKHDLSLKPQKKKEHPSINKFHYFLDQNKLRIILMLMNLY